MLLSPAKINLGLSVYHRRPKDGYHYLHSIFLPISFGDEIDFSLLPAGSPAHILESENRLKGNARLLFEKVSERGDFSKNILWKVLALLEDRLSVKIKIRLVKRIPPGGGLGGGSSNAGMLLRFLRDVVGVEKDLIRDIAVKGGADVPFFLEPKPTLVSGIGDKLQPVSVGNGNGILCLPGIEINTNDAYKKLKKPLQETLPPEKWLLLNKKRRIALKNSDWEELQGFGNDFEKVVFLDYPILGEVREAFLEMGAEYASMSGSGSSVFALFPSNMRDSKKRIIGKEDKKNAQTNQTKAEQTFPEWLGKRLERLQNRFENTQFIPFSF